MHSSLSSLYLSDLRVHIWLPKGIYLDKCQTVWWSRSMQTCVPLCCEKLPSAAAWTVWNGNKVLVVLVLERFYTLLSIDELQTTFLQFKVHNVCAWTDAYDSCGPIKYPRLERALQCSTDLKYFILVLKCLLLFSLPILHQFSNMTNTNWKWKENSTQHGVIKKLTYYVTWIFFRRARLCACIAWLVDLRIETPQL